MTSLLQQQLLRLAAPQTHIYKETHTKPSILFDSTSSKSFSREDYFDIGLSGFTSLLELEPKFAQYSHLFDKQSVDVQRFVADVQSNRMLDEALEGFLLLLSPYFMTLKPAMKAMEWLLQRYCIHEMNVDAVMMCILPYYDTPLFLRTLKVLNIEQVGRCGEQNRWQWLSNAQKSGVCLVNSILFEQWQSSASFRMFCNTYLKKVLKAYEKESDAIPAINFYVTTVLGGVARTAYRHKHTNETLASDDHVYSVVRVLHLCLKSTFPELVAGTYLILMQLAISVKLQPQLWNQIFALALKHARPEQTAQLSSCIVTVCHQQQLPQLDTEVIQLLQQEPRQVLQHLSQDRHNRRVAPFLVSYAGGYMQACVEEAAGDKDALQQRVLLLVDYIVQFTLTPPEAGAVMRNMLETVCRHATLPPPPTPAPQQQWLAPLLQLLEQTFPDGYDRTVQHFAALAASPQGRRYQQVYEQLDQITSRMLTSELNEVAVSIVSAAESRAAACVRAVLAQQRRVTETVQQHGASDALTHVLVHRLLDDAIEMTRLCTKVSFTRVSSSDPAELERVCVKTAEQSGRLRWVVVEAVADACLPAVHGSQYKPWLLLADDSIQATPSLSGVLMAVKLLRLLLAKPKRAEAHIDRLLQRMGDIQDQMRLLSLVWGWQPYLPQHSLLDSAMKQWCLERALQLLDTSPPLVEWCILSTETVLPSLVSVLSCSHDDPKQQRAVRQAAAAVVAVLWQSQGSALRQDSWKRMLAVLHEHAEAICMDAVADELVCAVALGCSRSPELLQTLVKAITLPTQPPHLAAVLLFTLSSLQHKSVFEALLPGLKSQLSAIAASPSPRPLGAGESMLLYWSLLQLGRESAELLQTELCWEVFSTAIHCIAPVISLEEELLSPQAVIAEQVVSQKLLQAVKCSSLSGRIWSAIATAAADLTACPRDVGRLRRALRDVTLHARYVLDQINEMKFGAAATSIRDAQTKRIRLEQEKGVSKLKKSPVSKRTSTSTKADTEDTCSETELPANWRRLQLFLEMLCEVQCVEEPWLLVEPLCRVMHEALALGMMRAERVVQQILASLHHLIKMALAAPPTRRELRTVVQLNVEVVVQCVRKSSNPYTHRRALLVLTLAAKILPDAVLHNLMTIFTFMGEGLLQRDDQFSYQVIETSITTLVPILVQRSCNSAEVCGVAQVFVDALPDIPVHRRLLVFGLLTTALRPQTHLWLVDMLIVKSYVLHGCSRLPDDLPSSSGGAGGDSARRVPREIIFARQLTEQFSALQQLVAAQQVLVLVQAVPNNIGASYAKQWACSSNASLLALPALSAKQLRHLVYTSIGFLAHLFTSETFIAALVPASEGTGATRLQDEYSQLLTSLSEYLTRVTQQMTSTERDDALAHKFWCSLQRKLVEVLDAVCSLLQPLQLLQVTTILLESSLVPVRVRALELLRTRLLPSAGFFGAECAPELLSLLPRLLSLGSGAGEPSDCRQVALSTLQMLLRQLAGHAQPQDLLPVLHAAVDMLVQKELSVLLVMQAVLVAAESLVLVGSEAVAVLPRLLPALLSFLNIPGEEATHTLALREAEHLPLAAVTALYKVVEVLPSFLGRHMEPLLVRMCRVSWVQARDHSSGKLYTKLAALADLIKKKIEPKRLLPALLSAHKTLLQCPSSQKCCATAALELVKEVTEAQQSSLGQHQTVILKIITQALATRHDHQADEDVSPTTVETLEESAVYVTTHIFLQQNAPLNLTLYGHLQAWADELGSIAATTTLYRVVESLTSTLQSLFLQTGLADIAFGHAVSILQHHRAPPKKAGAFSAEVQLLQRVLGALSGMLRYDSSGFTTESRFQQLLGPLVDQVRNMVGGVLAYQGRVSALLRPCLLHLCTAAHSDALWADLNKKMLMLLREDLHPVVHSSVLSLTQSLVEGLGEDWLQPLLLDTLPAVTEALESPHPEVEASARELLTAMTTLMPEAVAEQLQV